MVILLMWGETVGEGSVSVVEMLFGQDEKLWWLYKMSFPSYSFPAFFKNGYTKEKKYIASQLWTSCLPKMQM